MHEPLPPSLGFDKLSAEYKKQISKIAFAICSLPVCFALGFVFGDKILDPILLPMILNANAFHLLHYGLTVCLGLYASRLSWHFAAIATAIIPASYMLCRVCTPDLMHGFWDHTFPEIYALYLVGFVAGLFFTYRLPLRRLI